MPDGIPIRTVHVDGSPTVVAPETLGRVVPAKHGFGPSPIVYGKKVIVADGPWREALKDPAHPVTRWPIPAWLFVWVSAPYGPIDQPYVQITYNLYRLGIFGHEIHAASCHVGRPADSTMFALLASDLAKEVVTP
jgi:hypothetical protein